MLQKLIGGGISPLLRDFPRYWLALPMVLNPMAHRPRDGATPRCLR